MAKCLYCGERNPDSGSYCSCCGKPLEIPGPNPAEAAMENAKKEFERDALVTLDRSKLTFVCELCGTINHIDSSRCVRCGKPRPRSEFVNALRKLKASGNAREDYMQARETAAAAPEDNFIPAETAPELQQPLPEEEKMGIYRFEPGAVPAGAGAQSPAVVQPFVIVPYVNTAQQLWQYKPQQVYRFEEYTYQERVQMGDAPKTMDELLSLKEAAQRQLDAINENIRTIPQNTAQEAVITYNKSKRKVRRNALATLIFSAALLVCLVILPLVKSFSDYKGLEVFKSLGNGLQAIGLDLHFGTETLTDPGWATLLISLGFILTAIVCIYIIIANAVKLSKGRSGSKGFLPALLGFAGVIAAIIGLIFISPFGFADIAGFVQDVAYGLIIILILPLILILLAALAIKNTKVER